MAELGTPLDAGQESIVYYNADNGTVVKSSNTLQSRDLQDALDGITLHNTYFPESLIKVIGFGMDEESGFQIITEQPFVQGTHAIIQQRIDNHITQLGFEKDNFLGEDKGRYKNSEVLLRDLTPKNVILTPGGNIIPIDTIMHRNTPVWGAGGTRDGG